MPMTSLNEGLAQVLPGEREEVEVLVPRPRAHLVRELGVADHEWRNGSLSEGEGRGEGARVFTHNPR